MRLASRSLVLLLVVGCAGGQGARSADRCSGESPVPAIRAHDALPSSSGGVGAWIEIAASHVEPSAGNNHILVDGTDVPIARISGPDDEGPVLDATAGQLTPRQAKQRTGTPESGPAHVVAFRIPAGATPGTHAVTLRTCGASSAESVPLEVFPTAAPGISSITVVRDDNYSALMIKGANLSSVDEVVLRETDGTVTAVTNVTRIDDAKLRAPVDKPGTYEVFVRSKGGLGGGPPGGMAVVR